jgi:integrase
MSKQGPRLLSTSDGRAYAKFNGRKISFGSFTDPDTPRRFDAFKAQWLLNGRELSEEMLGARAARPGAVSLDELAERFLAHLRQRKPAAWIANNLHRVEHGLRPARALYGPQPAAEFSPRKLEAVRRSLVVGEKLSRREINRRILEIRRCFRWAVAQELVPGDRAHALEALDPLAPGEFGTREGRTVGPVARETVDATLPYLTRPLAALVELLWWTGARPSELFGLRPCDIDRAGPVWAVNLARHKTAWKGKRRALFFGPQAQAVLEPFLLRPASQALFRPEESAADDARRRRDRRKTPLFDSHLARYERERVERAQAGRARELGETYDARTFNRAIARAIAAANRDRESPIPHWFPYQLRHAAATRIKREFGLEQVRVLLGHSSASMAAHYAEDDLAAARKVMEHAG